MKMLANLGRFRDPPPFDRAIEGNSIALAIVDRAEQPMGGTCGVEIEFN